MGSDWTVSLRDLPAGRSEVLQCLWPRCMALLGPWNPGVADKAHGNASTTTSVAYKHLLYHLRASLLRVGCTHWCLLHCLAGNGACPVAPVTAATCMQPPHRLRATAICQA